MLALLSWRQVQANGFDPMELLLGRSRQPQVERRRRSTRAVARRIVEPIVARDLGLARRRMRRHLDALTGWER